MDDRHVSLGVVEKGKVEWIYSIPFGALSSNMYFDVQGVFKFKEQSWQSHIARGITKDDLLNFVSSYYQIHISTTSYYSIGHVKINLKEEMKKIIELYDKYDDNIECAIWAFFVPA